MRTNDAVNAFGFKLKQEGFTQADFAIDALNNPDAITDFQTSMEIRLPLFNGGEALYGRKQATAGLRMASAQLERSQQEVRLNIGKAYWGLVLTKEALKAVQQSLHTAQTHVSVAQAHYDQQMVPRTDVLAAEVRLAELRSEEIEAYSRIARTNDGLTLIMGLESGVEMAPTDTLFEAELDTNLEALTRDALTNRPDLQAMEHGVVAARHAIKVERASRLPHLNAFARVDLDADGALERQGESWLVGAAVTWDLFQGFYTVGAVQKARARLSQAEAQTAFLRQQIERDVSDAFRTAEAARARIRVAEYAVLRARERLRIGELQYAEGVITSSDLLDAETTFTQTQIRRLQALHDLTVGQAQLAFAVGRALEQ